MKKLAIKSAVAAVALSLFALSANAMCPKNAYRTYYLDRSCHYYYIDTYGNKVYEGGRYDADALRYSGMAKKQDCHGRWYYEDSWGNKVYKSRRCS